MIGIKTGQRHDVRGNVATFQRIVISNVATLDINVSTFQRLLKTNVATLKAHVATFQRSSKTTSRRWISTSRRSRECQKSTSRHSRGVQNQRRDVGISRRDVPEGVKIEVTTFRRRDVATSRRGKSTSQRYREGSKCTFSSPCLRYETLPSCNCDSLDVCNVLHKRILSSTCVCES